MKHQTLALLAATTLVAAGCSSNDKDPMSPPPMTNTAPAVSAIANVTADQDNAVGPVEFGVTDDSTPANMLKITAAVDANTVFPADGVVVAGEGATRSVTLTPLEARTGTTNVAVTVTDAQGAATTRMFVVTVNARAASIRDSVSTTFAKGEADAPTTLNGFTFAQDADDPATFSALLGDE